MEEKIITAQDVEDDVARTFLLIKLIEYSNVKYFMYKFTSTTLENPPKDHFISLKKGTHKRLIIKYETIAKRLIEQLMEQFRILLVYKSKAKDNESISTRSEMIENAMSKASMCLEENRLIKNYLSSHLDNKET